MTRTLPRLARVALALATPGMLAPTHGLAQIASPSNAGGNSGYNASGSSSTPLSTPSFTPTAPIPALQGVTVVNASEITATPQQTTAMQTGATQSAALQSAALQLIVADGAALPQVVVGPEAQVNNISLDLGTGSTTTTTSIAALPAALGGITGQTLLTLGSAPTGLTTTISATGAGGVVTLSLSNGQSLQITTTPQTTVAVMQFAAIASVVGLSLNSIQLGLQILALILQAAPNSAQAAVLTVQLLAAIQGLSAQTNLANLAQGITTFNALVASAPPEVLVALAANATFTGIGAVLRAAQAGIAAGA